jgi:hypothetical protein
LLTKGNVGGIQGGSPRRLDTATEHEKHLARWQGALLYSHIGPFEKNFPNRRHLSFVNPESMANQKGGSHQTTAR